jgi:hypothetical protein
MNYIDTFDYELVGFFAWLPLYHPLEAMAGSCQEVRAII